MTKKIYGILVLALFIILFSACSGAEDAQYEVYQAVENVEVPLVAREAAGDQQDFSPDQQRRHATSDDVALTAGVAMADAMPAPVSMPFSPAAPTAPASSAVAVPQTSGGFNTVGNVIMHQVEREIRLIKRGNLRMETYEFDAAEHFMREIVLQANGFIERSEISLQTPFRGERHRVGTFTFRVPVNQFEKIFEEMQTVGEVLLSSSSSEDATATFYDTQSILESRRVEEERILHIMGSADTVEELIQLERRLSDIRADMLRLQSSMNNIDRLASYSTITVSLNELIEEIEEEEEDEEEEEKIVIVVEKYERYRKMTSLTLGERMGNSFRQSLSDIGDGIAAALVFAAGVAVPVIIVIVAIGAVILAVAIAVKKKAGKGGKREESN